MGISRCRADRLIGLQNNTGTFSSIGDGVLDEVAEDAVKQFVIAIERHGGQTVVDSDAMGVSSVGEVVDNLGSHLGSIDGGTWEEVCAFLEFVNNRHILNEVGKAEGLTVAALEVVASALVINGSIAKQYLQIATDGTDGGLEFVGNIGSHFLLELPIALPCSLGLAAQAVGFVGHLAQALILEHQPDVEHKNGHHQNKKYDIRPIHSRNLFCLQCGCRRHQAFYATVRYAHPHFAHLRKCLLAIRPQGFPLV